MSLHGQVQFYMTVGISWSQITFDWIQIVGIKYTLQMVVTFGLLMVNKVKL